MLKIKDNIDLIKEAEKIGADNHDFILLSEEELLVKKFQMLAEHADKEELKCKMESIAKKHQGHFNELYQKLS